MVAPAFAHHSFAVYDHTRTITISGTVTAPGSLPLSGVQVTAYTIYGDRGGYATSDASGNYQIHGLIAGLLAPLSVGSTIYCTPGFNALKFFSWMAECRPTWYTAVPTMHQAIVGWAAGSVGIAGRQTGIYPIESPGGWQIVGRTPARVFDPIGGAPPIVRAGDSVQFVPIDARQFRELATLREHRQ